MKKFLVLGLLCVAAIISVQAQDSASDDKATRKALIEKYDTDKNGKLDKDEISKMTDDDKAKWKKVGHHKKKADADAGTTSTNAAPKLN